MNTEPQVAILEWDSQFFGHRIARITTTQLDIQAYRLIDDWSKENHIDCLYFLANSAHQETIRFAEANDFNLVDIRMTYAQKLPHQLNFIFSSNFTYRFATEDDFDALLPIMTSAYELSRFYVDPCFGPDQAIRLYETWLQKSIRDSYADVVIIAELDGQRAGFVTCHLNKPTGEGNIGLIEVARLASGKGVGKFLVTETMNWFYNQGMEAINVVTQGRNIGAQRLYQRCGLMTRSTELWYHKWLTNCKEK